MTTYRSKIEALGIDEEIKDKIAAGLELNLKPIIEQIQQQQQQQQQQPTFEVKILDKTTKIKGLQHDKFKEVLILASNKLPVYLYGPAGTGKTYLSKQVATALDLPYYGVTGVSDEFQLLGYKDAQGVYQPTDFRQAFENGGVFMIDELDNADPSVLVKINTALANDLMSFPDKMVTKNKDFVMIAAGNTNGRDGSSAYNARGVIDASTLDRFTVITVNYDPRVEKTILGGNYYELLDNLRNDKGVRGDLLDDLTLSVRSLTSFKTLVSNGINKQQAFIAAVLKGRTDLYTHFERTLQDFDASKD